MKAIGIRAKAKEIFYCIVEEAPEYYEILNTEKFVVPQALEMPDRLSYIRTTFESIIKEYGVSNAGIRSAENIQSVSNSVIERIYIEGVLQELLSNCSVDKYFAGRKTTIARLLKTKQENITAMIEGSETLYEIEAWHNYIKEEREALVAGFSALNIGGIYE